MLVVCIDGPSGSGKGTLCQLLAQNLGFHLLDSGAMYRLVGLAAQKHALALNDEPKVAELAHDLDVRFEAGEKGEPTKVILEGEDVSQEIRLESTGDLASQVAVLPAVRSALLDRQRAFAQAPGLVADGRDMGTVVFPDAKVKIYLTASAEERTKRRVAQLEKNGAVANFETILADIEARDKRDSERTIAPLKPASDAIIIDASALSIEQVLKQATEIVANAR